MINNQCFASDNYSGVHPKIFEALLEANSKGHLPAYGNDHITESAIKKFRKVFESPQAEVFFVFNGSASNVLALKAMNRSYEAILCPHTAHIANDECGAPEFFLGSKLILVPTQDGKIYAKGLDKFLLRQGDTHHVQLRSVSVSLTTELGTLYSLKELRALGAWCRKNNLRVHVDGARFSNAVAALGCQPKEIIDALGVSALSFGGTKNGLLCAEAIVFFDTQLANNFRYVRKQSLQLASKMRFSAAQFIEFFNNDLWLQNARHSNGMARYFEKKLLALKNSQIRISYPVDANALFVELPPKLIKRAQKKAPFYVWDEQKNQVRWMCSFDTQKSVIDDFVTSLVV